MATDDNPFRRIMPMANQELNELWVDNPSIHIPSSGLASHDDSYFHVIGNDTPKQAQDRLLARLSVIEEARRTLVYLAESWPEHKKAQFDLGTAIQNLDAVERTIAEEHRKVDTESQ